MVRLFILCFLPLFTASILTPGFMPGGKDKLRGNVPSLPAAASRFLIGAESGKKQSRTARGYVARVLNPSEPTAKYTCAIQGLVYIA